MTRLLTSAVVAALGLAPLQASASDDPLSALRWKHRLVVLCIPDTVDGREALRDFRQALNARIPEMTDRDLLVVPACALPREGDVLLPGLDLSAPDRASVRQQFRFGATVPQLALVGKDGGVKLRQSREAIDLDRVFEVIDVMPMRRAEKKQGK